MLHNSIFFLARHVRNNKVVDEVARYTGLTRCVKPGSAYEVWVCIPCDASHEKAVRTNVNSIASDPYMFPRSLIWMLHCLIFYKTGSHWLAMGHCSSQIRLHGYADKSGGCQHVTKYHFFRLSRHILHNRTGCWWQWVVLQFVLKWTRTTTMGGVHKMSKTKKICDEQFPSELFYLPFQLEKNMII